MTAEQIAQWKVERDIARKSGDGTLVQKAYDHRDDMMMECIQHQADRVKKGLENDIKFAAQLDKMDGRLVTIEGELPPLKKTAQDYHDKLLMAKGAKTGISVFVTILKYAATAGGGAAILKLFGG